jgi:hypothetical protein
MYVLHAIVVMSCMQLSPPIWRWFTMEGEEHLCLPCSAEHHMTVSNIGDNQSILSEKGYDAARALALAPLEGLFVCLEVTHLDSSPMSSVLHETPRVTPR